MDDTERNTFESLQHQLMRKSVEYLPSEQAPLSLIVQQSLTLDSIDGQNFPFKLWFLINNPAFGDVIHWSQDGTAVVFPDDKLFVQKVLKRKEGKIFKTESLKSFVRQLNLYGFRKVMSDRYDAIARTKCGSMFDHECFIQGRPDLLEYVKRRCNVKLSQREGDPTPASVGALQSRMRRGHPYALDYEDRSIKRRLRFSPDCKENTHSSSRGIMHKVQTPLTPFTDHFLNTQSGSFPFCHPGLFNPGSNNQQIDVLNLDAFQEAASMKMPSTLPKVDQMKLPMVQPSVVTLPKSMIMPTPMQSKSSETTTSRDDRQFLLNHLPSNIFSPSTPSDVSLAAASYLKTPTTLFSSANNSFSPSPSINLYSNTGPSPLSALCASLFSPFYDPQNVIHKATQTSGGPKTVITVAEGTPKMDAAVFDSKQ